MGLQVSESTEQTTLFRWLRKSGIRAFAVPNGISTSRSAAMRAVREGLTSGIPDLLIIDRPPALIEETAEWLRAHGLNEDLVQLLKVRAAPCGVAIELKRADLKPAARGPLPLWRSTDNEAYKWQAASDHQKLWLQNFTDAGWIVAVCYGAHDARNLLRVLGYQV